MKKWTIGKRIIVGFASVGLITTCFGAFFLTRLAVMKKSADSIVRQSLPTLGEMAGVISTIRQQYALVEKHILTTNKVRIEAEIRAATETTAAHLKSCEKIIDQPEERH